MGGRIILMASRALAAAAHGAGDYVRVYDRMLGQVREPVIIHWLGEMFDPALEGYWGAERPCGGDGDLPRGDREPCRQGGRDQDLAPVEGEGDRHAPAAAGGRAHVYRRRLQLCRADRGGRGGAFGRAARHLRRHRAGRVGGAGGAGAGRGEPVLRHPRADRAAVAAHLQGADPLLQDGRGVPRLSQRAAGPFRHGRRAGERAVAGAPGRALPAGGQGGGAARPRAGGGADARGPGGAGRSR